MPRSIKLLRDANAGVEGNPTLKANMEVVKIGETGSDWVIRDFDGATVPLKNALGDAAAAKARADSIAALEAMKKAGTLTEALKSLLGKLNKGPSANLHWSPTKGKIIVIDMQ
jgi:hypothetical protein